MSCAEQKYLVYCSELNGSRFFSKFLLLKECKQISVFHALCVPDKMYEALGRG